MTNLNTLKAYTDGSYKRGIKRCGFGLVLLDGQDHVLCGIYGYTDAKNMLDMWNVGGEIEAANILMEYILNQKWESLVNIYHDYEGISKWPSGRWRANKPATRKYAQDMHMLMNRVPIKFHHVRGHSGVRYNEWADQLAKGGLYCKHKFNICDMSSAEKLGVDRVITYQTLRSVDKKEDMFYGA